MTATTIHQRTVTGGQRDDDELLQIAHRRAVQATPAEMAAFFQDLLGQQLTALMTGIANPKAVGKWARGERSPRSPAERKLRDAYHAAVLIAEYDDEATARAWFMGMNSFLHDRSPIKVLGSDPDGGERVMDAALSYLAYG